MNRRGFLQGLGALVGGVMLEKAIPLGRVWSFPKEVKCVNFANLASAYYDKKALDMLQNNFMMIHPFVAYDLLQDNTAHGHFNFFRYAD